MVKTDALPCNLEAERLILGSILLDASQWDACADTLTADDFSMEANRLIWGAMAALREAGKGIDRVTVYEELRSTGKHDAAGGLSYIVELDDGMPRIVNLDGYVRMVRDKSVLRRAAFACQNILGRIVACGPDEPADLLADGENLLSGLRERLVDTHDFRTPRQIIEAPGGLQQYLQRREMAGIESSWPKLNHFTHGLQPGELAILAASTGGGKTALALNWAYHAARHGHGVAFFSMEMGEREINDRLLSLAGSFDSRLLWGRQGADDRRKITTAAAEVVELPIYVRDKSVCTVPGVTAAVRRLRAKHGVRLAVVDYLQLMTPSGRYENRTQEVSSFSRGLKRAAQELEIPFLVLSQLSRRPDQEKKREPELTDLRESGSIEQDANLVLFLYGQHDYQAQPQAFLPIHLILAKQRKGPARLKIPLLFRADCGRFETPVED